jgi:hypothetical protein
LADFMRFKRERSWKGEHPIYLAVSLIFGIPSSRLGSFPSASTKDKILAFCRSFNPCGFSQF